MQENGKVRSSYNSLALIELSREVHDGRGSLFRPWDGRYDDLKCEV